MGVACIAYTNLFDDAALTHSTQELLLPASNLQNEHVRRKWRSVLSDAYVVADLGSAVSIDTFGMFGLTASTIRLRVSTSDSSGASGDLYDSGVVSVDATYDAYVNLRAAAVTGRYVRWDFTHSTLSYVEAGRGFIGSRTAFGINFEFGWQRAWVDRSIRAKTRGGQTQVSPDDCYRTLDLDFANLSEAEKNGFLETLDRVNGLKTDVLFVTDEDSSNLARDSIWGLMTASTPVVGSQFDRFTKKFQIEERL